MVAVIRGAGQVLRDYEQIIPITTYEPKWPTAKGRPYNGRIPNEPRKLPHRRRQLTGAERLRICEEYLAGYDRELIIERWELNGDRSLGDIVSRLLGETAKKVRQMARLKRGAKNIL